jgi:hypothetical protein
MMTIEEWANLGEPEWQDYAASPPAEPGVYEWRVPSTGTPGIVVRSYAHMRTRGAGRHEVLSPDFDYWNGYHVIVPKGTQWRVPVDPPVLKRHTQEFICIEGIEVDPCPFCGKVPAFKGVRHTHDGGCIVTSNAHEFNTWWLACCRWADSPHVSDPRKLAADRNELLRVKGSDG